MRLPWPASRTPPPHQVLSHLLVSLHKLTDSIPATFNPEQEQRLLHASDFPRLLDSLCSSLIEEDSKATGDFLDLLERCLEGQVFGVLVAEALVDRPVGVFDIVVEALGRVTEGVRRQPLLANGGYCRALSDLLEYSCAHLEQGSDHHAVLSLLLPLCRAVHRSPGYCSLFMRKTKQAYLPLELCWIHFEQEVDTQGSTVQECLLYLVQTEEESVVCQFLLTPSVSQRLIFKLNSYFQTLPQTQAPSSPEGLTNLSNYASFLDDICRLCLWPKALKELIEGFSSFFCEGVLAPRLTHSDPALRSSCCLVLFTQYLRFIITAFHSSLLLLPLLRFFSLSGFWERSIEAEDALVRLRCLQLLYVVLEKEGGEATRELMGEGGSSERAMTYEEFREEFREWIQEEASSPSFPLLCASPASDASLPSTGETLCCEASSSTGDECQSPPSEFLLLLLLKLKRLDSNSLTENLLLTVWAS